MSLRPMMIRRSQAHPSLDPIDKPSFLVDAVRPNDLRKRAATLRRRLHRLDTVAALQSGRCHDYRCRQSRRIHQEQDASVLPSFDQRPRVEALAPTDLRHLHGSVIQAGLRRFGLTSRGLAHRSPQGLAGLDNPLLRAPGPGHTPMPSVTMLASQEEGFQPLWERSSQRR